MSLFAQYENCDDLYFYVEEGTSIRINFFDKNNSPQSFICQTQLTSNDDEIIYKICDWKFKKINTDEQDILTIDEINEYHISYLFDKLILSNKCNNLFFLKRLKCGKIEKIKVKKESLYK